MESDKIKFSTRIVSKMTNIHEKRESNKNSEHQRHLFHTPIDVWMEDYKNT